VTELLESDKFDHRVHATNRLESGLSKSIFEAMNFSMVPPVVENARKSGRVFFRDSETTDSEGRTLGRMVRIQDPKFFHAASSQVIEK